MEKKYGEIIQDDKSEASIPKDFLGSEKVKEAPSLLPSMSEWFKRWISGITSSGSKKESKGTKGVRTLSVTKLTYKIPVKVPMQPGPSCEWFLLEYGYPAAFSIQYCGATDGQALLNPQISGKCLREIHND